MIAILISRGNIKLIPQNPIEESELDVLSKKGVYVSSCGGQSPGPFLEYIVVSEQPEPARLGEKKE